MGDSQRSPQVKIVRYSYPIHTYTHTIKQNPGLVLTSEHALYTYALLLTESFKSAFTGLVNKQIPLDLNTFQGAPVRKPSSFRLGLLHSQPKMKWKDW